VAREYYSDSVQGPRPRIEEQVDDVLWSATLSLLERSINTNLLAHDFPELCEDGGETYATDRLSVMQTIRAEIPDLPWPPTESGVPPTLAVLDLFEFLHRHASKATRHKHHSFFDHHHLRFDRRQGQEELREMVNRLLARTGMAYELDAHGDIVRLAPPAIREQLQRELPPTRDKDLDALLGLAIAKYLDPDPQTRRDAIEKLWDAFERAKTVPSGKDKKARASALASATAGSPEEADVIAAEMLELTRIGNKFRIRHHEVDRIQPPDAFVDYLFARMYALLYRLHPALR
jgi:hypothetical protein